MTTASKINKELTKQGINGEIYRGNGYYYFIGGLFDKVPAIYSNNLKAWTTKQVVEYVKTNLS